MNADGTRRVQLTSTPGSTCFRASRTTAASSSSPRTVTAACAPGGWRSTAAPRSRSRPNAIAAPSRCRATTSGSTTTARAVNHVASRSMVARGTGFRGRHLQATERTDAARFSRGLAFAGWRLPRRPLQDPAGERMLVVPTAGGPLRKLVTVPPNATWAPDGRSLVFYSGRAGVFNVFRASDGGPVADDAVHVRADLHLRAVTGSEAAGSRPRPREFGCGVDLEREVAISYQLISFQLTADG